jgi:thiol-disulfide isomerase/thioredoxin
MAVALVLAASSPAAAADERLRPWRRGETPALAGVDLSGREIDLRALRGRVVLVGFWASWCEPCAAELAALARLRAARAGRPLEIVTVNLGEGEDRARAFVREHGVELPVLLDRDRRAGEAFGVGGLPMSFLVDARGRVRSWVFGETEWTRGELAAALERLLAEAERPERARHGAAR